MNNRSLKLSKPLIANKAIFFCTYQFADSDHLNFGNTFHNLRRIWSSSYRVLSCNSNNADTCQKQFQNYFTYSYLSKGVNHG